jgi:hypothetical protein
MSSDHCAPRRSRLGSQLFVALKRQHIGVALACLAVGVTLAGSLASATEESVGFVLEKHGDWIVDATPPRTLAEGDRIPAGAKVRPKEDSQGKKKHSLTICLYTGTAKVYTGPATLPARYDPSVASRLWRAIAGRHSGGYVRALSRGTEISDGVVRLENHQIDLSPVFHPDVESEYHLRFTSVARAPATKPVTVRFQWSLKRPAPVKVEGLRSGLYECMVVAQDGQPQGDATNWVLVSEPRSYEQAAATYREAVALSEAWDADVSPYAIFSFRRSCLKMLAEPARE